MSPLKGVEKNRKSTVLLISNEGTMTGAPLFLERLATGLANSTEFHVVVFFSSGGPIASRMRTDGFETYISVKRPFSRRKLISLFYRVTHYFNFIKILWLVRPNVVYSNTIVNCGETVLSRVFGFPTVLHMHEGMNFASKLKSKLLVQTSLCKNILVGSEYAGRVLRTLTGHNATVVPIGISDVRLSETSYLPSPSTLRVGILGTLDENKGQLIALKALALAVRGGMNIQLFIAGAEVDKDYGLELRNFVVANKLDNNVFFLGRIDSVDSFFQSIDVLTVCSYDEVLPTVILEAMREKKLVVATRVGGIPEIIEHGSTGLLCDAGNEYELLECFQNILRRSDVPEILERAYMKFMDSFEISKSVTTIAEKLYCLSRYRLN